MEEEKQEESPNDPNTITNDLIKKYQGKQQSLESQEWELGIDEAGRGPVLGPMVQAILGWPKSLKTKLSEIGFADSKKLTEEKRDYYFEIINKLSGVCLFQETIPIQPNYLSNRMLEKDKQNLNLMSFDTAFKLINNSIARKINITDIIIDTVGIILRKQLVLIGNPKSYEDKLNREYNFAQPQIKFKVEEKADANHPVVSAASICAKVTRDSCINKWVFVEKGLNETISRLWGTGYPHDTLTKKWLKDNFDCVFGFPEFVRFSWGTIKEIFQKEKLEFDFHEEEDENPNNLKITEFMEPIYQKKGVISKFFNTTNDFSL